MLDDHLKLLVPAINSYIWTREEYKNEFIELCYIIANSIQQFWRVCDKVSEDLKTVLEYLTRMWERAQDVYINFNEEYKEHSDLKDVARYLESWWKKIREILDNANK